MFKKIFIFTLFSAALIGWPIRAELANGNFVLDEVAENAKYKEQNQVTPPSALFDNINKVVSSLLGLSAILFFGFLTYAGVRWMTAKGNEEFVTKARETMEAAVIGLIVITAAYAITNFIFTKLAEQASAPPAETTPPAGCEIIKTEADCQAPACEWVRTPAQPDGTIGRCQDAPPQSGGAASCFQFSNPEDCGNGGGCIWTGSRCIVTAEDVYGICLRVISGQLYCEYGTQQRCTDHGASYSFYAGKNEEDCAAQQASYLPLPDVDSCVDQGGTCIEGSANISTCSGAITNLSGCSYGQVCCWQR